MRRQKVALPLRWELPAYCYVRWYKTGTSEIEARQLPWRAFSEVKHHEVQKFAERMIRDHTEPHPSREEPPKPEEISYKQMRTTPSRRMPLRRLRS